METHRLPPFFRIGMTLSIRNDHVEADGDFDADTCDIIRT